MQLSFCVVIQNSLVMSLRVASSKHCSIFTNLSPGDALLPATQPSSLSSFLPVEFSCFSFLPSHDPLLLLFFSLA